jgi:hypothetical protein
MKSLQTHSPARLLVLAFLAACFSTGVASGQDSKGRLSNWENLKSLTRGQEIRVQMNNDQSYQGEFESLSDDGITLRQATGEQTLARKAILRVSKMKGQNHRARNVLYGAIIGAALGLAAGLVANQIINNADSCTNAVLCNGPGPPNPHWALIGTPVVAGAGALIGAVVPTGTSRDIYRSPGWHHLIYRAH